MITDDDDYDSDNDDDDDSDNDDDNAFYGVANKSSFILFFNVRKGISH